MSITRRRFLTGSSATAIAAFVAAPALVDAQPTARIPSSDELAAWRSDYRQRYKSETTPPWMQDQDTVKATVAETDRFESTERLYAEQLEYHEEVAVAKGMGFGARRDGKPQTVNPFPDMTDQFFSWHRGWLTK